MDTNSKTLLTSSAALPSSVNHHDLEEMYLANSMQKSLLYTAANSTPPGKLNIDFLKIQLPVDTNLTLLHKAWESTVMLYPSLRTAFCRSTGLAPVSSKTFALVFKPSQGNQGRWYEDVAKELDNAAMEDIGFAFVQNLSFEPFSGTVPLAVHIVGNSSVGYHLRWCMQHAIYDGSSIKWFLRAFHQFYHGVSGIYDTVPAPSFSEVAQVMNREIVSGAVKDAHRYWRRRLLDLPEMPWPPIRASVAYRSQPLIFQSLYRSCPSGTDDPDMPAFHPKIVRAVLGMALALHSGVEDHVFCETRSYRESLPVPLQAIAGPCLFSAVLRLQCSLDTKLEVLIRAAEEDEEARMIMHNAPLALGEIIDAVDVKMASNFRVYLAIHARSFCLEEDDVPGWQLLDHWEYHNMPISIDVFPPCDGAAQISFRYDASIQKAVDMATFADHFVTMLTLLSRETSQHLITVNDVFRELGIADRDQTLGFGDGPLLKTPPNYTRLLAHELFDMCARQNPTAVALQFEQLATMTYGDLATHSTKLAYELQSRGVKPEMMVPILFETSFEMIIAILAVMKAGGAYVPLGIDHPTARLQRIIEISGAKFILYGTSYSAKARAKELEALYPHMETLEYSMESLFHLPSMQILSLQQSVSAEQLAYVLFTSGSTGTPKGVAVEHRNLCAFLSSEQAKGSAIMRELLISPYTFDVSIADIFSVLTSGGILGLVTRTKLLSNLPYWLNVMQTTHLSITPSVGQQIPTEGLPHLRHILFAGETLPVDLAIRLTQAYEVSNLMGPTEVTIFATEYAIPRGLLFEERVPIGHPIGLTTIYIVRPSTLDLVAKGEVGEICMGGPQVARGYISDPNLSDMKFVVDPFSQVKGARLFRTGDLGRWNEFGQLDHLGRLDGLVKLRGLRVETGEIRHVIQKADQNICNVFIDMLEKDGQQTLAVAFTFLTSVTGILKHSSEGVIPLYDIAQQLDSVKAACVGNLPPYMRPSLWLCLTHFPTDNNGKLDHRQLRKLLHKHSAIEISSPDINSNAALRPPSSQAEHVIALVLSEILNRPAEAIDLDKSFLSLGGNSLQAMRLTANLHAKGIGAKISDCLDDSKTVAMIAASPDIGMQVGLNSAQYTQFSLAYPGWKESVLSAGIPVNDVEDVYPLETTGREWLDFALDNAGRGMICRFTYDLGSNIDPKHFAWSWEQLRLIEPAHRTVFVQVSTPDKIFQRPMTSVSVVIKPDAPSRGANLEVISCQTMTESLELIRKLLGKHRVEVGVVPIQAWLIHSAEKNRWFFVVSRHHALHDGRSLGFFGKDFNDLYVQGQAAVSAIKSKRIIGSSYGAFMYLVNDLKYRELQDSFWRNYLAGSTPSVWPSPLDVPVTYSQDMSNLIMHSDKWDGSLFELAQKAHVTRGALLRSAVGIAIAEKEQRSETVVYEIVDGISEKGMDPWGFCVHVNPTKICTFPSMEGSEKVRFLEVVRYANQSHIETLPHHASGFDVATEVVGSQVHPGFRFQTYLLNILDVDDGDYYRHQQQDGQGALNENNQSQGDLFSNSMISTSWDAVSIPLYFELRVTKTTIIWVCAYDGTLFRQEEIESLVQRQKEFLHTLNDMGRSEVDDRIKKGSHT